MERYGVKVENSGEDTSWCVKDTFSLLFLPGKALSLPIVGPERSHIGFIFKAILSTPSLNPSVPEQET